MLPLTTRDKPKSDDFKPGMKLRDRLASWIKSVFEEKASRNIFFFLLLNLTFAFLELFYGMWSNSLGLISDSFHMFFDCTALLTGLIASIISRWGKNERYSYGYVRAEVMAGFVNALFLLFVAFFIFSEAVERAFHPPHVEHERLFLVSILGFLVNLIGIFVFGHGHADGDHGHSHGGHGHSHGPISQALPSLYDEHADDDFYTEFHTGKKKNKGHSHNDDHGHGHNHGHGHGHGDNHSHSHGHSHDHGIIQGNPTVKASNDQILKGVFLHILADTLGSVGVIISSGLIAQFGWMMADPLCSMFISVLIAISVFPLLLESASVLLQRTPREIEKELPGAYQRVSQIDGVYSIQDPHFWTLCSNNYVGTLRLLVSPTSDTSAILSETHNLLAQVGVKQLYVQIEKSY